MNGSLTAVFVVACLWALASSLPVDQNEHTEEKPLIRAKRTEEIVYGNHQNSIRIKKTGPVPAMPDDLVENDSVMTPDLTEEEEHEKEEEKSSDSPAEEEENAPESEFLQGEPAENIEEEGDVVDTNEEENSSDFVDDEESTDETEDENTAAETGLEQLQGEKEENSLENLVADGENAFNPDSKETDTLPDRKMSVDDWYEYIYRPYMLSHGQYRQKRSAATKQQGLLDAEHMMAESKTTDRVKRDLTEEDLEEWLAENQDSRYGYPELYTEEESPSVEESEDYLQRLFGNEEEPELGEEYYYDDEIPESYNVEEEDDEDIIDPEEVAKAKLAILKYLYDVQAVDDENNNDDDAVEESYMDLQEVEPTEEIQYEPIVYNGVPGIFIPVKRQYMSLDPGLRKRASDFYPYSYEPAGRWNALVPDLLEEKRTSDAYERLYRLAQALDR